MSENQTSSPRSNGENTSSKMMFLFGLVTGIAIVSVLVSGSLLSSVSGDGVQGASANDTEVVDDTDTTVKTTTTTTTTSGDLPAVSEDDHIRGNADAKVVLVEYSDFECPFCGRHHPNMLQAMEDYGDDVAWVYRHFPLSFHPEAEPAAIASECVAELVGEDAFWDFADTMFANQDELSDDYYAEVAADLGVNATDFADCVESGKYDNEIASEASAGAKAGVTGTPATFVNGEKVSGAVPYATFAGIIEDAIDAAE